MVRERYDLPFDAPFHKSDRLSAGWVLSAITRFGTGFPVTFTNASDNSLLGTEPGGVNGYGIDLPDIARGPLEINHDPRNGQPYCNTALFSLQPLGQVGSAPRRLFYGPGIANFDTAISKTVTIRESRRLEFRLETFNTFNHTPFFGPASVVGEITSDAFAQVVSSAPPRLAQGAIKFLF